MRDPPLHWAPKTIEPRTLKSATDLGEKLDNKESTDWIMIYTDIVCRALKCASAGLG